MHTYLWEGTRLIGETCNGNTMLTLYDTDGAVCGILYNGARYYFNKNLQGDVISIINMEGNTVAKYTYDAWGKLLSVTDAQGTPIEDESNIALINPYRYRGYYFDSESNFYYLQTRYYDPETGRFISLDNISYLDPQNFTGLNLYAYCGNDPVGNIDPTGCIFISALLISMGIAALIGATTSGLSAYNSGERGKDLVADIVGGAIFGAAIGATIALGGAAGLAATGATVAGFGLSTGAALGISVGVTAAAGMAKYSLDCVASTENNWNVAGFAISGIEGAIQAVATFGIAFVGGKSGWFNKLGEFKTPDIFFSKYGGMNNLRAVAWASKVAIGEVISKAIFVSTPAAIIRWLIDMLIPNLH